MRFCYAGLAVVLTGLMTVASEARPLKIVVGEAPPMVTTEGGGRDLQIIREVLELCGHEPTFVVQPYTRHWESYRNDSSLDGISTVTATMDLPGTLTVTHARYQNGVSMLESNIADIGALEDLRSRRVVAFGGARTILPGLDALVPDLGDYREVAEQETQARLLFAGRTDAIIGDGMIFARFNQELRRQASTGASLAFDPMTPVQFKAIFPPSDYQMRFRDATIAADFDRCFAELDEQGRIDAINKIYVDDYRATLGTQYLDY